MNESIMYESIMNETIMDDANSRSANESIMKMNECKAENGTPPLMSKYVKQKPKPNVRTDELLRSLPVGGVSFGCSEEYIGEHAPIKYKPQHANYEAGSTYW